MCDQYNHEGQLCGKCKPPVILSSYGEACLNCTGKATTSCMDGFHCGYNYPSNFHFVLLFFVSVDGLSPYLNAFVLYAQLLIVPGDLFFVRILTSQIVDLDNEIFDTTVFKTMFLIYGIWNLDFCCL